MARSPVLCLHMVLFFFVSGPAPARAAPGAANAPTTSDAACITPSGIDAHCYGAAGNGSTDDTAALDRAVSAALATGQPLFLPHGTYMLSRPVVIDYRTRSDTGFRVVSMGAILDGKTIARQPVLEIECSGGTAISPKGCF